MIIIRILCEVIIVAIVCIVLRMLYSLCEGFLKSHMDHVRLVLSVVILIAVVLYRWWDDYLFDTLFILSSLIIGLPLLIALTALMILTLGSLKSANGKNVLTFIVVIVSLGLFIGLPLWPEFRRFRTEIDLYLNEERRKQVIEEIGTDCSVKGNYALRRGFKSVSSSGEVYIVENNEAGQEIIFWIFRGMLSGSVELVYSTGGEEMIYANESGHPIISVDKLKDDWYYVETDY